MLLTKWKLVFFCCLLFLVLSLYRRSLRAYSSHDYDGYRSGVGSPAQTGAARQNTFWSNMKQRFPVMQMRELPAPRPGLIPKIQATFTSETSQQRNERLARLEAVKSNFTHAWTGYKTHAWLKDEVMPISGAPHNPFGGWAASLVDSLDTLWIMGLKGDFEEAVEAVQKIDFSQCALDEINLFETTIRHLGGLLAAHDLSHGQYPGLLDKAIELGEMLYFAFDTPNRLPITRWNFKSAAKGAYQEAGEFMLLAEIGSLTLEFTRLSQVTGDPKWYDAVQRIMDLLESQQAQTKLPGMWPTVGNARAGIFTESDGFTIGGMADSTYEYLPKQYLLLTGGSLQYRKMYESAIETIRRYIFYQVVTPEGANILFPGDIVSNGNTALNKLRIEPRAQHLGCFAGGMVGLAAKAFENPEHMDMARRLVEGCLWGYEKMPNGMMPEVMHTTICQIGDDCTWNEQAYKDLVKDEADLGRIPRGITRIDDKRYILRPEAIESVFILYRLTGDTSLPDRAWTMFNNIIKHTKTDIAHAALDDCSATTPQKQDRMESFWLAETLKYFYLIFSEPDVVSLDEYVLNTEAHPLRRPK